MSSYRVVIGEAPHHWHAVAKNPGHGSHGLRFRDHSSIGTSKCMDYFPARLSYLY